MKLRITSLILSMLLVAAPLRAVLLTWTGAAGNGDFFDGVNWGGPTPTALDDFDFPNVTNRTVSFNAGFNAGSLNFISATSTNYTLNGSGSPVLTLNGDLTAQNTTNSTITFANTLNLQLVTGEHVFDVESLNTVQIDGVISGPGHLTKAGSGILVLTGVNTYNYTGGPFLDATSINAGTLHVDGGTINHTGTGDLQISLNSGGTGDLQITNGGTVNDFFGVMAQGLASFATATVSGTGSSWNNSSGMDIGNKGTATLDILLGAHVTVAGNAFVGWTSSGSGTVTVDGAGSSWNTTSDLTLGGSGTGVLTVSNGASVTFGGGTGNINLAASSNSNGILNIGNTSVGAATLGGIINASTITTGSGAGIVQFNTTGTSGTPYYFTRDGTAGGTPVIIDGPTNVTFNGGYNVIAATNNYSGLTAINGGTAVALYQSGSQNQFGTGTIDINNGGTLLLKNDPQLSNGQVNVNAGGRLAGSGYIGDGFMGANVTVNNGGVIAPGTPGAAAIGTLTIDNLVMQSGAIYEWNLQNPTGFGGLDWDLLAITAYSATLHIDSTTGSKLTLKLISLNGAGAAGAATGFSNQAYSWMIFDGGDAAIQYGSGSFDPALFAIDASAFTTNLGGGTFTVTADVFTNSIWLNFTPVPEPSTYALMALGLVGTGLAAWRRKWGRGR